ncbi:MAG: hypothetical protein LBD67_07800 [Candidatus Accumulibacter sp.]|jgi:hypothetical protein|nr:hypothetical protein [Accumulibacter sp.]
MKFTKDDFPRLRVCLAVFAGLILCGALSVYLTLNAADSAKRARAAARASLDEFERKLRQVRNEEKEIREKAEIFTQIQKRGIVGEEQRLEWVELIDAIRTKERLFDIEYEIDPQRVLYADPDGEFSFVASLMRIRLPLLHEEDLTRLIDELRQKASALIRVRNCSISRLQHAENETGIAAYLTADCRIDWITLRRNSRQ